MTRPSRRMGGRLAAALLAVLLLVGWDQIGIADAGIGGSRTSGLFGGALPVAAAADCVIPTDGDVFQGPDERTYLYTNGTLRAIPDRETLRALGVDPNGVDPIQDECLQAMRFGSPLPSVGRPSTGSSQVRSVAETPAAAQSPSTPGVTLDASNPQLARRTSVRLTARTDAPDGNGLVLSIHRAPVEGGTGTAGLVTTCANTTSCTVQVWEDEARGWTFVATLYRCSAPGTCVAVQESDPVGVTWQ